VQEELFAKDLSASLSSLKRHLSVLLTRTKKEEPMTQPTPAIYTVQAGDSLWAIAQRYYGDGSKYHRIYDYCNKQVIGPDEDRIYPGQVLYIPPAVRTCKVTVEHLNARAAPTTQSALLGDGFRRGTVLTYFQVVNGQNVQGNKHWGLSDQNYYYFWLGGTDHQNG
jgi:LysM repeat protein